ncbi:MAG TPA: ferritin family protein [Clostridia bacterium]|jgi:rubrerythrin|nr:ferritin family protein [Clostridia bacterium]
MLSAFNGLDVITFAVEIEKNGKRFYEKVSDIFEDTEVKKFFLNLANEEEKHISDFEKLLKDASGNDPQETYKGEYIDYVKSLVDNHVFNTKADIDALVKNIHNKTDALDLALKFEKDSILFFTELKELVAPHNLGIIDNLISQERNHIRLLAQMK